MSHVVVLGAGLGGVSMAYEMKAKLGPADELTVVNLGSTYSFVPSNPWVAVGWRKRADIAVDLAPVLAKRGIALWPEGVKRVYPKENRIELNDGSSLAYDYLIIATGPDLAFDEIPGLGPDGYTQWICHIDHAEKAKLAVDGFEKYFLRKIRQGKSETFVTNVIGTRSRVLARRKAVSRIKANS